MILNKFKLVEGNEKVFVGSLTFVGFPLPKFRDLRRREVRRWELEI
jgi:hypothetical protein